MSFTLVLNSNNVVPNGSNSKLQYKFIEGGINIPDGAEMCLLSATIPYSFFNVRSDYYNNSSFSYKWPVNNVMTSFTVLMPNGFYNVNDINNFMQSVFIANGHYLVNSSGLYVYYLTMQYNISYYAVQVVCYPIPTSLPSGYTNPSNVTVPTVATTPELIIGTNNFGAIIGYKTGSYPATVQSTTQSFLSNITPNASPVNSLIIRCNLVDNNAVMPSDILTSMPINGVFGSNLNFSPTFGHFVKLKAGKYANLNMEIVDQNFNQVLASDPNLIITLLLRFNNTTNINK